MAVARAVDPRLRVVYLGGIAVAAFLVHDPRIAGALVAAHAVLWLALGLGARALVRQVTKLWGFAAFIVASYALTSAGPDVDRWVKVDLGLGHVSLNAGGALLGGLMIVRVVIVVLASGVARAGDSRAIALGLRRLGAPDVIAASMDAVLALLGDDERARGRRRGGGGGGGGGGRGRGGEAAPEGGFLASLKRLARGDVAPIVDRIERHIARAEDYVDRAEAEASGEGDGTPRPRRDRALARDIAVIAGLSLTMLGIKALKVLPSIPLAPGHKLVLLTPLYIVAALRTRTRAGATLTGLVMGSVAFLLGDGRYGIFEILKHIAPGVLCDVFVPFTRSSSRDPEGRIPGALTWSILGGIMGVGRFATIFTVTLAVQAPAVAWAMLVPGLIVHTTFGVLSGLVSSPLIRAVARRSPFAGLTQRAPPRTESPRAAEAPAPSVQDAREP